MISTPASELWRLVLGRQHIEPRALTAAIEEEVAGGEPDYRTRLLIHDSVDALQGYWGRERVEKWLQRSPVGEQVEAIWRQEFEDDVGFPSLRRRVMDVTHPEMIRQYLRDLSRHVRRPTRIDVAGSVALILRDYLAKKTEDVDVVDEVPAEIRNQHQVLADLKQVHHLEMGHVQRHYLPMRWEQRIHWHEPYGLLQIYLLDAQDVFLSKLFSLRTKDKADLKELAPKLDKESLAKLLREDTQAMLASDELRKRAEDNWFMLYGEPLPS